MKNTRLLTTFMVMAMTGIEPALSLPPQKDIPEEILRSEIFTEARSPINGKPLTAAEYVKLQSQLQSPPPKTKPQVNRKLQNLIFLLQLRRVIRTVVPLI